MTLELFLQILKARRRLAFLVGGTVVLLTLVVSLIWPKQYTASTSLAIDVKANDPVTGLPTTASMLPGYLQTQVDILTSQATALNVVDALGLTRIPEAQHKFMTETGGKGTIRDWLASSLLKGLDVVPGRESSVISLSYTATDPKFASTLANSFAQEYIHTLVDMRAAAAQQNNAFFQQQLKVLQANLEQAQKKLADYQQQQGLIATDEKLDVETQHLGEITSQLVGAQSATFDAQARARGADAAPDVLNNPLVQQLKNQLAQAEVKFKEEAERTGPNHPHYQQALASLNATRQQLADVTRQYAGGLNNAASNSAARQAALLNAAKVQKDKLLELKSQRSVAGVLESEVANAQRAYDQALQRYSQTMLESRSDLANVAVLEAASEPLRPSRPLIMLNLIVSILVGAVLGVGASMLGELLNRRVRSVSDLEAMLELPVLAVIKPDAKPRFRRGIGFLRLKRG
ncbi:chain length determinant protein EpsF [Paludibacterium yongneupense]|uniref:chain length determinant protein EpsF n=1 Tax=Paludibacterium yongneupense TaxID=400061 RepID=UPI00041F1238|nr:chain length determinant protein EpsF [Paludibacterium yongneupense]